MNCYVKAYDIVGYTYCAEILCPTCTTAVMVAQGEASPAALDMSAEDVLNQVAGANAVDRDDETSFDSDDFPKVVLALMVSSGSRCDNCAVDL
jgi:hypothetical protein